MRHFPAVFASPDDVITASWAREMHGVLSGMDDLAASGATLGF